MIEEKTDNKKNNLFSNRGVLIGAFALVGVLVLGLVAVLVFGSGSNVSVRDTVVTNITDTALTVAWVSDEPYVGKIAYREASEAWPAFLPQSGATVASDDRDIELNSEGEYVVVEGGEKARYTHHVTLRNLKPETEYSFRVVAGFGVTEMEITNASTRPLIEELRTPDPAYGRVAGADSDDGLVVLGVPSRSELGLVSTTLSSEGTYSLDVESLKIDGTFDSSATLVNVYFEKDTSLAFAFTESTYKPFQTVILPDLSLEELEPQGSLLGTISASGGVSIRVSTDGSRANLRDSAGAAVTSIPNGTVIDGAVLEAGINLAAGVSNWYRVSVDGFPGVYIASTLVTVVQDAAPEPAVTPGVVTVGSGVDVTRSTTPTELDTACDAIGSFATGGNVNIRSGAGTNYQPIGTINNRQFEIFGCVNNVESNNGGSRTWYQINVPITLGDRQTFGYVASGVVRVVSGGTQSTIDTLPQVAQGYGQEGFTPDFVNRCYQNGYWMIKSVTNGTRQDLERLINTQVTPEDAQQALSITDGRPGDMPAYIAANSYTLGSSILLFNSYTEGTDVITQACYRLLSQPALVGTPASEVLDDTPAIRDVAATPVAPSTTESPISSSTAEYYYSIVLYRPDFAPLGLSDEQFRQLPTQFRQMSNFLELRNALDLGSVPYLDNDCIAISTTNPLHDLIVEFQDSNNRLPTFTLSDDRNAPVRAIFNNPSCSAGGQILNPGLVLGASAQSTGQPVTTAAGEIANLQVAESGRYAFFRDGERIAEADLVVVGDELQVRLFNDLNGNGVRDEGEDYFDDYTQITLSRESSVESYNLTTGWNLIHLPLTDIRAQGGVRTAGNLVDYWNNQGADIKHVARYRDGRFQMFSKRETGTEYSADFDLIPGEGLFILNLNTRNNVTFPGNRFESSVPLRLANGWNLVGIMNPNESYNSRTILEKMQDAGIRANIISQFENSQYTSVVNENDTFFGNDFNISDKRGYFVRVEEGGGVTFTP